VERRRTQRLPLTLLMRVCPSPHLPDGEDTITKDVSTKGVFFYTSTDLGQASEIEFVLALPPTGTQVRYKGKVVRVEPYRDGTFGVGVATEAYEYVANA
jgi:hypothetical protein